MIIEYLGHSAFLIKGEKSVVLDPFKSIGYDMQKVTCDYCISSHNHFDHNAFDRVNCSKIAAQADGATPVGFEGINLSRIKTYHDDKMGKLRGDNYVSVFSIDGVTFAHLGDLGEADNQQLIAALNGVDVLFIPVGGTGTNFPAFAFPGVPAGEVVAHDDGGVLYPVFPHVDKVGFQLFFCKGTGVIEGTHCHIFCPAPDMVKKVCGNGELFIDVIICGRFGQCKGEDTHFYRNRCNSFIAAFKGNSAFIKPGSHFFIGLQSQPVLLIDPGFQIQRQKFLTVINGVFIDGI